jgi:hypothetical protein
MNSYKYIYEARVKNEDEWESAPFLPRLLSFPLLWLALFLSSLNELSPRAYSMHIYGAVVVEG